MVEIATYRDEHFSGVDALWKASFPNDPPWNRAEVVIPMKVATQPDMFIVAVEDGSVAGAALAGYDGHRGWLYSVAVRDTHCRKGVGSRLVRELERRMHTLGCHKINLQVRSLNVALLTFYHALGYITADRITMGRQLP